MFCLKSLVVLLDMAKTLFVEIILLFENIVGLKHRRKIIKACWGLDKTKGAEGPEWGLNVPSERAIRKVGFSKFGKSNP